MGSHAGYEIATGEIELWLSRFTNLQEKNMQIDKSNYPRGVWDDEPDKITWIDSASKLNCMILRNSGGALCGYVGVPESNQYFGSSYNDVPVSVHGGLTYADLDDKEVTWQLGFDCAHFCDYSPGRDIGRSEPKAYKDIEYVKNEVTQLAAQLVSS